LGLITLPEAAAGAVVDHRPCFFFMVGSAGSPAASTKGGGNCVSAAPKGRPRVPALPLPGLLLPALFLLLPLDKGLPTLASDADRRRTGAPGLELPAAAAAAAEGACVKLLAREMSLLLPTPPSPPLVSAKSLSSPRLPVEEEGPPLRTGLASRAVALALACAQKGERASTHRCSSASVLAHSLKRWPLSTWQFKGEVVR